jgi:nucleoside-diphosphate-sugar epimerase
VQGQRPAACPSAEATAACNEGVSRALTAGTGFPVAPPDSRCTVTTRSAQNPLAADLDDILTRTRDIWEDLRGQRLFITGGTGFFGCWILESLLWANMKLGLQARAVVLTRRPAEVQQTLPRLVLNPAVTLLEGDVRSFAFPSGHFSHIIHAATESTARAPATDPLAVLDTIVGGTRHTLDFAVQCQAHRFLLTGSGAVYGRQPPDLAHVPEEYVGAPDPLDVRSAYGQGKRLAEHLCAQYAHLHSLQPTIARCFALAGPYLPLHADFAFGNFIDDALRGGPIIVSGDGTPVRSYLYAGDLAVWLWTILVRGQSLRPYNVGSDAAVSIAALAHMVAESSTPALPVVIRQTPSPGVPPQRYVPSTRRSQEDLDLREWTDLPTAISKTKAWHVAVGAPQDRPSQLETC